VLGVGPFDGPLTERLAREGLRADLVKLAETGIADGSGRYPYLETVQARLPEIVLPDGATEEYDLVICRYILEHCHDPLAALSGLKRLLKPNGKLLIEVPDCEKFLMRRDYSFVWEEHICYFSETTLNELAARAGFRVVRLSRYDGALEDALVAVLERSAEIEQPARIPPLRLGSFAAFVEQFTYARDRWHQHLGERAMAGRIALLGVGHQAIMFVNALGLADFVTTLADDQPEKQSYFAPGMGSAIIPSEDLARDAGVGTWLLAISPGAQERVRTKFADLLGRGLGMYSIFP
jgi:hypothetical protein